MTEPLQPGSVLGGKWTLVGPGVTTEVGHRYDARGPAGEACVVHAFPTSLFGVQGAWQAFQRDARASTGLATDVVVARGVLARTLEAQVDAQLGVPYAVVEAIGVPSLEAHVAASGLLGPVQVALLLEGIAPALDAAHAAGLVHGALDPTNVHVRLGAPPELRVEEFGFAHLRATAFPGWRARGRFASPEAQEGAPLVPATDVQALGVLAFFALVGKSPYLAAQGAHLDPAALAREITSPLTASARAQQLGGNVPAALDAFFTKALDPVPGQRFTSPSEVARAFSAATSGGAAAGPAGKKQFASTMLLADAPRGGAPRPGAPRPASPKPPGVQPTPSTSPLRGAAPAGHAAAVVIAPPPIVPAPPTMIGTGTPQPPPAAIPSHAGLGVDAPTPIEVPSPFHGQPAAPPLAAAPPAAPGAMSPAAPLAATPTPYTATPQAYPPQAGGPVPYAGAPPGGGYPPGAAGSPDGAEAWGHGAVDPMAAAMAAEEAASLPPPRRSPGWWVPVLAIGGLFVLGGIAAAAVWAFTSRSAGGAASAAASASAAPSPPPQASAAPAATEVAAAASGEAPAASVAAPAASAEPPANPLVKLDCGEPGCGAVRCDDQSMEVVDGAFRLPPGKHPCVVETEGYQPKKLTVTVVAGRDVEQRVALTKKRDPAAAPPPAAPPPASKVPAKPPKKCGTFIKCK
ncbi:MAG: hypothetical protein IT376_08605 [Polyangiaceae bacterium]|nr:hypothetical protein [Polyangiaceae bacterium]